MENFLKKRGDKGFFCEKSCSLREVHGIKRDVYGIKQDRIPLNPVPNLVVSLCALIFLPEVNAYFLGELLAFYLGAYFKTARRGGGKVENGLAGFIGSGLVGFDV